MIKLLQQILMQFRSQLYLLFFRRQDAIFNLLDALTCHGHRYNSIVQLCESEQFKRKYSSITDAIADGLPYAHWDEIERLVYKTSRTINASSPHRFVIDCTSSKRPFAEKLSDRTVNHSPNPSPGNKPICIGHQYSVLGMLPGKEEQKRWIVPLSAHRVRSHEKGNEVGMKQIISTIKKHGLENELCVSIGDSLYGTNECRRMASIATDLVHIFRLNSKRNIYFSPAENEKTAHKNGRKREFGKKFNLSQITPDEVCDKEERVDWLTSKGKKYEIRLKCWYDMLLRGSRNFRSAHHPLSLIQVTIVDENEQKVFRRPLYLGVMGVRRREISIIDCYQNYRQRYDIEHFFRFGKQKLLLDSFQTPDVEHEEAWWKLAMVSYSQLYFSRELALIQPKPWERYLPDNKNIGDGPHIATPSQTQRSFSNLLESIGSPAKDCVPRGRPVGRLLGESQLKRPAQPVIFKGKKSKEGGRKSIVCRFEKLDDNATQQKIDELLKFVHTKLDEINLPIKKFTEILLI